MSALIKVLVVDDSSFMRNMLARLLDRDGRFEVVGKAKDGAEGVSLAKSLKPNVITMDIEMPNMNGIEALKIIMKSNPTPVVMVSSLTKEGATATLDAMDHGAVDFIPKAMEDGAGSVLNNSSVLMDKIYAASHARIIGRRTASVIGSPTSVSKPLPKPLAPKSLIVKRNLSVKLCVIGSSTGGPRALQEVIPKLTKNIKVPIVVAQHMPAHFTGAMAERLDSISNITVVEGKDGDNLESGTVYIAPGGLHTRVNNVNGNLVLSVKKDTGKECVYKPSVDILTSSAINSSGSAVLGLMMTGMGTDGAKNFENLKNKGGYILTQDKETSVVHGMSKAVEHFADEVLALEDISSAIIRLIG